MWRACASPCHWVRMRLSLYVSENYNLRNPQILVKHRPYIVDSLAARHSSYSVSRCTVSGKAQLKFNFSDFQMTQLPTMPPPPGIIANFDSPYSLQRYDILCQTVCFTLTTLLLCIRLYTKIRVLRHAGWDDCGLFCAIRFPWLTFIYRCLLTCVGESHVLFIHSCAISADCLIQVGLTTYMILNLEEDKHGNGRHIWNIRGSEVTKYAKVCHNLSVH